MKKINVMVTAFRDGFQSVFGARVQTKDFLPALEAAVEAGLTHFEVGGGARFQSLYFYCNEDAFEMMDACRTVAGPDANLQTLARGINVVGLESQPSDIIKMHAELFRKHGITTIRNFDALNDIDNLDYSGRCIADAGLKHEVAVTLMGLPPGLTGAHTAEFYVNRIQQIIDAEIPMHSLVLKDASGTAVPQIVYDTVLQAKKMLPSDVPLRFHTHDTAGTGIATYRAAIEAGVDGIDLSMAPVSGGTSQPDIITMWHALRDTEYELDVDIKKVMEAEEIFKDAMKDYFFPPEAMKVEPLIPFSPMPGGALTANTQMMRDHNVLHRFPEVIAAMREVVERGGFATSVTPVSQFYFQQAFNNVVLGPWKKIADGYGKMLLGYFGKTPTEPDPELVKLAAEQMKLEPTTESPRLLNDKDASKGRGPAEKALKDNGLEITEENIFIAATCKERGIAFLKGEGTVQVRKIGSETPAPSAGPAAQRSTGAASTAATGNAGAGEPAFYTVSVGGETFEVKVSDGKAEAHGEAQSSSGSRPTSAKADPTPVAASQGATDVTAPMPGVVLSVLVKPGDAVKAGQSVVVMECMKMEMKVEADADGSVSDVHVKDGQNVEADQVLVSIA
ncbi:MAG: biotin/lipoyl-binding protein [Spirochaetaceae bacterium]|nr:MAG: biotin/lipoyl-binding protein [Spirochaetaceae bacterium]